MLPFDQNDRIIMNDSAVKRERVREWLSKNDLDGVIISRRDQFAWLTSGGDNRVLNNTELGFGHAVITRERQYLVAQTMDAARILEEQVPGQGYELVPLHWYDEDPRVKAQALAGKRAAMDAPLPGKRDASSDLTYLHYPLTSLEIDRCRWLGQQVEQAILETAASIQPGQTEEDAARSLHVRLIERGIEPDVLILGSDDRIFRYRHPLPTRKTIDKYVLLHPAARRWGLHANVTRSLHFGPPPATVQKAYRAAATIEARVFALLAQRPSFAHIFEMQKVWYAELGFPEEWRNHFQGGLTGYVVADTSRCLTDAVVSPGQAFDWFITITGAKVEELSLLLDTGFDLASACGDWPSLAIDTLQGRIKVPDLLVR